MQPQLKMKEGPPHNRELVQRIMQGDGKAFRKAFYAYKNQIFSYCYRFTTLEELAEGIVHDALLKVWTGRQTLNPKRSFIGYLYTITRNLPLISQKRWPPTRSYRSTCGNIGPSGTMILKKACMMVIGSESLEWQSVNFLLSSNRCTG